VTAFEGQWPSVISLHVRILESIKLVDELICSYESALYTQCFIKKAPFSFIAYSKDDQFARNFYHM